MRPVALDSAALQKHPLPPVIDGDKETKGRILIIAGSRQVPGAALLCATAAMRAGAGKLRIATIESAALQTGLAMPEAMVTGMAEDARGCFAVAASRPLGEQAATVDAVVAGPGMAEGPACAEIAAATGVLLDHPCAYRILTRATSSTCTCSLNEAARGQSSLGVLYDSGTSLGCAMRLGRAS